MTKEIPALILSGGSEIVAAALIEELLSFDVPIILISLGKESIFKDIKSITFHREMTWPPLSLHHAIQELGNMVVEAGHSGHQPWPVFATEDGGLRLLMEGKEELKTLLTFSHASNLKLGGLDKAELFEYLQAKGLGNLCAPTFVATQIQQIPDLIDQLGGDCIVKPSLKPFSMELDGMPSKIFSTGDYGSAPELISTLQPAWHISKKWLVQKRLQTPASGEAVYWAVSKGNDRIHAECSASNLWKQPRMGGSGCWVYLTPAIKEFSSISQQLIYSIRYSGILELEFLLDNSNRWRLLEMNPRPWLQVGLPYHSGVPMAAITYDVLTGRETFAAPPCRPSTWVNPERMIVAAFSGEYGNRIMALKQSIDAIRHADVRTIYDLPFPSVKRRWLKRMLKTGFRRLSGG